MHFLVDANLSARVVAVFTDLGFDAGYVNDIPKLLNQPDEVIFNYAVKKKAIIVTRDKGFTNPSRFDLKKLPGFMLVRFPNEINISSLSQEMSRLLRGLKEEDFYNLIVIEPGSIRKKPLG